MAEPEHLVVSIESVPVVRDRTEMQLSDGMDEGETRDPPPRDP